MPFAFNAVELYVVTVNEKHWTRAKEVWKALEYNEKTAHVIRAHCSRENYAQKYDLISVPTAGRPVNWPKYSQKYGHYINEEGCMRCSLEVNSRMLKRSGSIAATRCFRR